MFEGIIKFFCRNFEVYFNPVSSFQIIGGGNRLCDQILPMPIIYRLCDNRDQNVIAEISRI